MVKLNETLVFDRTKSSSDTVTRLNLWGCDVDDIELCSQMPHLVVLALSVNNVKVLEPLMHCLQLEELYVRKNNIEDIEQIEFLRPLRKLRTLWLDENPCDAVENYRLKVISALPQLKMLDNRRLLNFSSFTLTVTKEELELAATMRDQNENTDSSSDHNNQSTTNTTAPTSAMTPRSGRTRSSRRSSHNSTDNQLPDEARLAVEPMMFQSCYGNISAQQTIPQQYQHASVNGSPYGSLHRDRRHQSTERYHSHESPRVAVDPMSMSMYAGSPHSQSLHQNLSHHQTNNQSQQQQINALQSAIANANEQLMAASYYNQPSSNMAAQQHQHTGLRASHPSMHSISIVDNDTGNNYEMQSSWGNDFGFDDPPSVLRDEECGSPVMPMTGPSTYMTQQAMHTRKRYNRSRSISPSRNSANILIAITNLLDELDPSGLRAVIDEAQRRMKKVR